MNTPVRCRAVGGKKYLCMLRRRDYGDAVLL
jgi:hypothetical protein